MCSFVKVYMLPVIVPIPTLVTLPPVANPWHNLSCQLQPTWLLFQMNTRYHYCIMCLIIIVAQAAMESKVHVGSYFRLEFDICCQGGFSGARKYIRFGFYMLHHLNNHWTPVTYAYTVNNCFKLWVYHNTTLL